MKRKKAPWGVYRIGGYEAICDPCGWYGTPGLDKSESRRELRWHIKGDKHQARLSRGLHR